MCHVRAMASSRAHRFGGFSFTSSRWARWILSIVSMALILPLSAQANITAIIDDNGDGDLAACAYDHSPGCQTIDHATVWVDKSGVYTIYLTSVAFDSGDSQYNESFFIKIKNSLNPTGHPLEGNCVSNDKFYSIIEDINPNDGFCGHPSKVLTYKRKIGRFVLKKGVPNSLEMYHYCPHALDKCPGSHQGPGPCNSPCGIGPQSIAIRVTGEYEWDEPPCEYACYPGKQKVCITSCGSVGVKTCDTNGCGFGVCKPRKEVCNGVDDNCDGKIDEKWPLLGVPCAKGTGACTGTGVFVCNESGIGVHCTAKAGDPSPEVCDGKDNDCDGKIDENWPLLGASCNGGVGECKRAGVFVCDESGSGVHCTAKPGDPSPEICDGKDNDCDTKVDEDFQLGQTLRIDSLAHHPAPDA